MSFISHARNVTVGSLFSVHCTTVYVLMASLKQYIEEKFDRNLNQNCGLEVCCFRYHKMDAPIFLLFGICTFAGKTRNLHFD